MADPDRRRRRKNNDTDTGGTPNNGTNSGSSIDIPKITDFTKKPEIKPQVQGGVTLEGAGKLEIPGVPNNNTGTLKDKIKFPEINPISDITNPGIKNTCDEKTFNKASREYEGGIRYEQLTQLSNKYIGEQFKSLASAYTAYSNGLASLVEYEKVKQKFLDLLKQQSITGTKAFEYIDAAHNFATTKAKLPYVVADREAKLTEAKAKAQTSFTKAQLAELEALEFASNNQSKDKAK